MMLVDKNLFQKFLVRQKLFSDIIKSGSIILVKCGEDYYEYCDTKKVPESAKDDLAIILADMTFNCPVPITVGGKVG